MMADDLASSAPNDRRYSLCADRDCGRESFSTSPRRRHAKAQGSHCEGAEGKRRCEEQKEEGSPSLCPAPATAAKSGCLVVVKIGTSTLLTVAKGRMCMNLSNLGRFVDTICELRARGHTVIIVSSGAVGAGCVTLRLRERPEHLNMKQALAAVGQCRLMRLYEDLFSIREEKVAQMLVSRHDLLQQKSYQNFRSALKALLALDAIPIINENDTLATEQLRFGDNDTLSAHIAVAVDAHWLFILTDVDCLFDRNPHKHADARPVALVDRLTDVYAFLSDGDCGAWGTGGMHTKIIASKLATNVGVHVAISNGQHPERILDILAYAQQRDGTPHPLEEAALPRLSLFPMRAPMRQETGDACAQARAAESAEAAACRREDAAATGRLEEKKGKKKGEWSPTKRKGQGGEQEGNGAFVETAAGGGIPGMETWRRDPAAGCAKEGQEEARAAKAIDNARDSHLPADASPSFSASVDVGARQSSAWDVGEAADERRSRAIFEKADKEDMGPGQGGGDKTKKESVGSGHEPTDDCTPKLRATGGQPFPSLLICDSIQQMPFLGTIFIAKDRRSHKKGDTRGWILSLPVRGKIFIDPGAVAALVQQKKSLFAAGVRHVAGNFAANECVAVYVTSFSRGGSKRLAGQFPGAKSYPTLADAAAQSGSCKREASALGRKTSKGGQSRVDLTSLDKVQQTASVEDEPGWVDSGAPDTLESPPRSNVSASAANGPSARSAISNGLVPPALASSDATRDGETAAERAVETSDSLYASTGLGFSAPSCPMECLEIARCISNVSSAELKTIKGRKSSEFRDLLGYAVDEEVAHRQHIVFTFMNGHEALKNFCLCKNPSQEREEATEPV
ncbi:glutamate 5-kinase domain-containing protein [Besnoitia besnoiti]|uniref:Glutamate 5-kinase domain-containing protein n=1 Tax=Besnoitia besnoiti TaxID=94643 RepID=A0A2A9MM74_BESBE|nr:glutamate 5-kinase domain-containing protein [Besnoitia besnoiti]PFH36640.1 glutamate 5-kinase domain-containing protein [Besnoitia besnoiti]